MELTKEQLTEEINTLACLCDDLHTFVAEGIGSKIDFLQTVADMETVLTQMKAQVIRHARQWKQGIRKNLRPDRRYKANRPNIDKSNDLRLNS